MEIQEVDVVIGPDGVVHIEVSGAKGKKCLAITKDLEEALGGQVAERRMKPEADDDTELPIDERQNISNG